MPLSLKQVQDICLAGAGRKSCRYLIVDSSNWKYYCGKLVKSHKKDIDERILKAQQKAVRDGIDFDKIGRPMGDNCCGYLLLKYKTQGYDL